MKVPYKVIFITTLFCFFYTFCSTSKQQNVSYKSVISNKKIKKRGHKCRDRLIHRGAYLAGEVVMDALRLNYNVFSVTTAKILTAMTPFYIMGRAIDERLQAKFYDPVCHKNICQLPSACHDIAKYGVGGPMVFLSSLTFWAPDDDVRETARMFAIGWPFVHSGKDIIKNVDAKICLRPWNENFSKEKRSLGGFPSGHMANVTYMTTLFGMRHGPAWGIPLGLFASFVFVNFLNCNRHYFSQLCAGAGLGIIYAFAANAVIEKKISDRFACSVGGDQQGNTTVRLAYSF